MSVIECGFLFVLSSARGGIRGLAHIRQINALGQRQCARPGRGFFSTMFFSVSRLSRRNTLSRHILARGVYQPSSPPHPTPPPPFLHHHSVPKVRQSKSTQVMVRSFRHSTLWDTTANSWCGRQMPSVPKHHVATTGRAAVFKNNLRPPEGFAF